MLTTLTRVRDDAWVPGRAVVFRSFQSVRERFARTSLSDRLADEKDRTTVVHP